MEPNAAIFRLDIKIVMEVCVCQIEAVEEQEMKGEDGADINHGK